MTLNEDVRDVPFRCLRCGGQMYMTWYEANLNVLKKRTWYCCKSKECGYEIQAEEFKRKLLTV